LGISSADHLGANAILGDLNLKKTKMKMVKKKSPDIANAQAKGKKRWWSRIASNKMLPKK
jgi:hypothetical protein